jgi:hypothetical protein
VRFWGTSAIVPLLVSEPAALLWSRGETQELELVCLDLRLREAALREGFRLLHE